MSGRAIGVAGETANAEEAAVEMTVVPEPGMEVVLAMPAVACLYMRKKQQQQRL